MEKLVIIIETSRGNLVTPVTNFSKENCINALSKVIKVDEENIEQVSASTDHGIYGIKKRFESAKELHTSSVKFYSNEYDTFFIVNYGRIV